MTPLTHTLQQGAPAVLRNKDIPITVLTLTTTTKYSQYLTF